MNVQDFKGSCESLDQILEEKNLNELFVKKELIFKILVIGDFGVGKTSIIRRYAAGTFSSSYKVTIGADFAIKTLNWDDEFQITLHLWDIAGYERFGHLTGIYYRHAHAAAIVFDVTRPQTFDSVKKWLSDLRRKVQPRDGHSIPVILLANKGDVTTETLPKHINQFCRKYNIQAWYITSAKNNVHIDESMSFLIHSILNSDIDSQLNIKEEVTPEEIIHLNSINLGKDKSCCHNI